MTSWGDLGLLIGSARTRHDHSLADGQLHCQCIDHPAPHSASGQPNRGCAWQTELITISLF